MLITHWFWAKHPRAINRIRCPIVFYFVWGSRTKLQDATHFTLSKGMEDSHSGTLHPQECGGRSSTPQQTTFFLLTTAHEGRSCRKQDPNLPRFNDKSKKMFQFSSFSFLWMAEFTTFLRMEKWHFESHKIFSKPCAMWVASLLQIKVL